MSERSPFDPAVTGMLWPEVRQLPEHAIPPDDLLAVSGLPSVLALRDLSLAGFCAYDRLCILFDEEDEALWQEEDFTPERIAAASPADAAVLIARRIVAYNKEDPAWPTADAVARWQQLIQANPVCIDHVQKWAKSFLAREHTNNMVWKGQAR